MLRDGDLHADQAERFVVGNLAEDCAANCAHAARTCQGVTWRQLCRGKLCKLLAHRRATAHREKTGFLGAGGK